MKVYTVKEMATALGKQLSDGYGLVSSRTHFVIVTRRDGRFQKMTLYISNKEQDL